MAGKIIGRRIRRFLRTDWEDRIEGSMEGIWPYQEWYYARFFAELCDGLLVELPPPSKSLVGSLRRLSHSDIEQVLVECHSEETSVDSYAIESGWSRESAYAACIDSNIVSVIVCDTSENAEEPTMALSFIVGSGIMVGVSEVIGGQRIAYSVRATCEALLFNCKEFGEEELLSRAMIPSD